jgi:hypothetical protein
LKQKVSKNSRKTNCSAGFSGPAPLHDLTAITSLKQQAQQIRQQNEGYTQGSGLSIISTKVLKFQLRLLTLKLILTVSIK